MLTVWRHVEVLSDHDGLAQDREYLAHDDQNVEMVKPEQIMEVFTSDNKTVADDAVEIQPLPVLEYSVQYTSTVTMWGMGMKI